MKKNKVLITFLLIILLTLTGCTTQLKDAKGKVVRNEETGQVLTSNLLCAPKDEKVLQMYRDNQASLLKKYEKELKDGDIGRKEFDKKKENILDVDKLVACKNFKLSSGGYDGIWTTIFVKPLVWLLIQIGEFVGNYAVAILLVTIIIRLVMYPITLKTAKQSENLKKAKPELEKIEKKYSGKKDQESTMKKSQEMMMVYKKHDINPLSGCLFGFIQIPLFFAFYESLFRLPVLLEDSLLGFNMALSPMKGANAGNWLYLILPVLVFAATYFAFKLNSAMSMGGAQEKQMKIMMNVMMVMIFVMSFQMSTGIIFYWITNNAFTIMQNLIVKRSK